jgi:hypothetical protein
MFQGLSKGDFLQACGGALLMMAVTYVFAVVFLAIV